MFSAALFTTIKHKNARGNAFWQKRHEATARVFDHPVEIDEAFIRFMQRVFVVCVNELGQNTVRLNYFSDSLQRLWLTGYGVSHDSMLDLCKVLQTFQNPSVSWQKLLGLLHNEGGKINIRCHLPHEFGCSSHTDTAAVDFDEYSALLVQKGILSQLSLRYRLGEVNKRYCADIDTEASHRVDELVSSGPSASTLRIVEDEMDVVQQPDDRTLITLRLQCINEQESNAAKAAMNGPKNGELLILKYNIDITKDKFNCLRPHTWLNDEVTVLNPC